MIGQSLRELAEVGVGKCQPVDGRRRGPVVIAAVGVRDAERPITAGRQVHGVVGDRAQRDRGRVFGGCLNPADAAQDAWQDPQRHGRLVTLTHTRAAFEQRTEGPERRRLVLVPPQLLQLGCEMLVRRPADLRDQRHDRLGQFDPTPARQRHVGNVTP